MTTVRARTVLLFATLLVALTAACSGNEGQSDSGAGGTQPAASPASLSQPAAGFTVTALQPSVEDALSCRVPPVTRTGPSTGLLQVVTMDTKVYPGAVCNDETPASLSFRPYEGEANRNKWVVMLAGGGSCLGGQECADRWCGVGTNFDADNMSTANGGAGATADGILRRSADNPFGGWNHVVIRYCSSDTWVGSGFNATLQAKDPKTGKDVTFQVHFGGAAIFSAGVSMLRRENGEQLTYTRGNTPVQLPDLDDATEVLFGGGSAGGAGTIHNLDRFASLLQSGPNKPVVRGFIDAILGPPRDEMRFESSVFCKTYGLCTYEAAQSGQARLMGETWNAWMDQSCVDWHKKNSPGTEWMCMDTAYLLENHVTTPYFIRMNLGDTLRSNGDIEAGFAEADGKVYTKLSWATSLQKWLTGLPSATASGREKAAYSKAPGIFAPACVKHYTLFNSESTYLDTVTANGTTYTMMTILKNWMANQKPDVAIAEGLGNERCPGDR